MGGGVSFEGLEPVSPQLQQAELLRNEIAQIDSAQLKKQMLLRFKTHSKIIALLCDKSKDMLQRVKKKYANLEPNDRHKIPRDLMHDAREMLGGPYGEFMRSLFISRRDVCIEYLECALSGIGCDESMVIDALCLGSSEDLKLICEFFVNSTHSVVNLKKIQGKTKKGSILQKFILRILNGDRASDTISIDTSITAAKAGELRKMLSSSPKNESAFLEFICPLSRVQCAAIDAHYQSHYGVSMIKAIENELGANKVFCRAIQLWMLPVRNSFVNALSFAFTDTYSRDIEASMHAAARLLGTLDKGDMSWVIPEFQAATGKFLVEVVTIKVSGKLKEALLGWIMHPSYDLDYEFQLQEFVKNSGKGNLTGCVNDSDTSSEISNMLSLQISALENHLKELNESIRTEEDAQSKQNRAVPEAQVSKKINLNVSDGEYQDSSEERADYDQKFQRMCAFLERRFRVHDVDRSGSLEAAEFWSLIDSMGLGFTSHEIEGMQQWCDWNRDGSITYSESVHELADHVITTIENNNNSVTAELDRLEAEDVGTSTTGDLAPTLLSFLRHSFESYDTDKSGQLSLQEFWPFIKSIFSFHLTDDDLTSMQGSFDLNGDGLISIDEALLMFSQKIHSLNVGQRDVWVGFVDKPTGKLFWYNLRDDTSYWMSEEDQARFRAYAEESASGLAFETFAIKPTPRHKKTGNQKV